MRILKFNAEITFENKRIYLKNVEISSDGSVYIRLDNFKEQTKDILTTEEIDIISEDYGRSSECEYYLSFNKNDCNLKTYQFSGLKDKFEIELFDGNIIADNVGRRWILFYDDTKGSFIFEWKKDRTQNICFKDFMKKQLPLLKISDF